MPMDLGVNRIIEVPECRDRSDQLEGCIRATTEDLIRFVHQDTGEMRLGDFERALWSQLALLFRLSVALFLAVRHERLDVEPWRSAGWRVKKEFATRVIKTIGGPVRYGRAYLTRRNGGGWFPLDAALGITQDGFSWRVIDLATRLATRVSYSAARGIFKAVYGWAPSQEAIESLAIGLGSRAPAFMETFGAREDDGEVLVIEVDGKAAPMATQAELDARRQKRKHVPECSCGCQRHRGRKRRRGKQKKRKKRGHNSKNGRSATLVAMYTLRRGEDGRLHGPINKKIWGRFGPRKGALEWARDQATRRGFGPDTDKRVQIVLDGERCLRKELQRLFPNATFTLDLRHAQEYLWKAGRLFHAEASPELEQWVEPLNALLQTGRVDALLDRLRAILLSVPQRGPNTKAKRKTLQNHIAYFEQRREIMRYDEYHRDDLVLATGVIEGACRYVVKERLDCAGMRWTQEGAERVLQLRCIELNGDWDAFIAWAANQTARELEARQPVQIRQPKPSRHSVPPEEQTACAV
jgi:hypothetical protein